MIHDCLNNEIQKISYKKFRDADGELIPLEVAREIPFSPARIFSIANVPERASRANHACMNAQFIYFMVKGTATLHIDDGMGETDILLSEDDPELLYIKEGLWIALDNFSKDAILLVVSNREYHQSEYVDGYQEYLKLRNR